MTRDEQLEAIRGICRGESFAVFAFAGVSAGDPPYSSVMFFAETPDLRLVFGTSPGAMKSQYLRTGNGVCAQIDTRAVGLENASRFHRVTLQGRLRRMEGDEREEVLGVYFAKLPNAKVFFARPGVEVYVVEPSLCVCSRGLAERFEVDFRGGTRA